MLSPQGGVSGQKCKNPDFTYFKNLKMVKLSILSKIP